MRGHTTWAAAILATGLLALPASPGVAQATENDLRDIRVGMMIADLSQEGYAALTCARQPDRTLKSWSEFKACPADTDGRHEIRFQFDNSDNVLSRVNDRYEGTKVGGHPVLLSIMVGDGGAVEMLRINTDPAARAYMRKKAFLFAQQVKQHYGEEGWECRNAAPAEGETAVGGLFIKEHCRKLVEGRELLLDRELYRRSDQSMADFVNAARVEIRRR